MIRCLLVDDHPVVRAGYRRLLEQSGIMSVVAEAGDVASGYACFQRHRPDVTIADLALPGASGLDLIRRIRAHAPEAAVLVFTMHETPLLAERALAAGAAGFITKRSAPEVLVQAVQAVNTGQRFVSPDVSRCLHQPTELTERSRLASLSPRELEIFRLLARGHSPADCARTLSLSQKTVANYQTLIKEKLGVSTAQALVHLALQYGLVDSAEFPQE